MKVLIADKFEQSGIDGLKARGATSLRAGSEGAALTDAIRRSGADVLVVRGTKVSEPMLDAGRSSLIVRAGAGYNTIDVPRPRRAASTSRIARARTRSPSRSWRSALMLALDRRIPDNAADLRAGKWNKKEYSKARGLYGATLASSALARSAAR